MPLVESTYTPPFWAKNGFVATVYSGLCRKNESVEQHRERITLNDGDFLDLDWSYASEKTEALVILLHGLEGNSQRPYIINTAHLFNSNTYDVVGINFRGCSGEPNALYRSYHSGATDDLIAVINHIQSKNKYSSLYVKGISLGANMILKYLGEGNAIPQQLKAVVAVSVPCDLKGSCDELHKLKNKSFSIYFLRYLKAKLKQKTEQFPESISQEDYNTIKSLIDFDNVYTSKAHGFKDALEYYDKCNSLQFLNNITIPTLIINAQNDSFLSESCSPVEAAKQNSNVFLETPKYGGHVGFIDKDNIYYNEKRALEFISENS